MKILSRKVMDEKEEIKEVDLDNISGGVIENNRGGIWVCPNCKEVVRTGHPTSLHMHCPFCKKMFKRVGRRYVEE